MPHSACSRLRCHDDEVYRQAGGMVALDASSLRTFSVCVLWKMKIDSGRQEQSNDADGFMEICSSVTVVSTLNCGSDFIRK